MDRFKNDGGKIFSGEPEMFPKYEHIKGDNTMVVRPRFVYEKKEEYE